MKNNKLSFFNLIITFFLIILIIGIFAFSFNFLKEFADKLDSGLLDELHAESNKSEVQETEKSDNSDNDSPKETIKIKFNLFKVDYDEENYEYEQQVLYQTVPMTVEKGLKFKYSLEDLSSEGFYASSDMVIEGAYNSNQSFDIYYYKCVDEMVIYESNSSDKSVEVGFSTSYLDDKCLVLKPNVNFDVERIVFTFDTVSGSYSYVVDDFLIPQDGYLVLFPSFGKISGFEKNGDSYNNFMTCKSHDFFEDIRDTSGVPPGNLSIPE